MFIFDYDKITSCAKEDKIAFKKHALNRMQERKILADDVRDIILNGEIIEEYQDDWPLPSCLVLGNDKKQRALHTVIAVADNYEMLWIITVYEPTSFEWEKGFKVRKRK